MHLKSYPKLMRSELHLEAAGGQMSSQQSGVFVSQHGMLLKTSRCHRSSSSSSSSSSSRFPFSIISTNTLHGGNTANRVSSSVTSLQLRLSHNAALQVIPQPAGCENERCSLYQPEDADAPLDIWAVIKPGHVREKIAIFASEEQTEAGERTSSGTCDRTPPTCNNNTGMSGLTRAVKAKGSWEDNCSAKRRRRSGSNQNLQKAQTTQVPNTQQQNHKASLWRSDSTQTPGVRQRESRALTDAEQDEQKVSVVEMVAFLEQRAGEQQKDCKPLLTLQRSSTTITLSRALSLEIREGSEVSREELESVRVSDRVAKLESECLRSRTEGTVSRSNSLRRTVGRVLLTAGDQSSAPSCLASPVTSSTTSFPSFVRHSETPVEETCLGSKHAPSPVLTETQEPVAERGSGDAPPQPEGVEPLPGFLFLSVSSNIGLDSTPSPKDLESHPPHQRITPPRPGHHGLGPDSGSPSEKKGRRQADRGQEGDAAVSVLLGRRVSVSQDFLEMRQRLQQLLEPQPYLAVLPHHLLVKIFLLLPTQSLAALKCTCQYFKFVIENYGVRPADSLWVSDPRYRDDPCKQCKRKYCRGDVSLCRWHHKPYCQALPYGPGYWMCCHGAHRDAPGCNVGLHDNRWVPAFHSVNVPIYRKSHDDK